MMSSVLDGQDVLLGSLLGCDMHIVRRAASVVKPIYGLSRDLYLH